MVTDATGQTLVIETESGLSIETKRTDGLRLGDRVDVYYDFTKNRIASIHKHKHNEHVFELSAEEPVKRTVAEDDEDEESIAASGSDALGLLDDLAVPGPLDLGLSDGWVMDDCIQWLG